MNISNLSICTDTSLIVGEEVNVFCRRLGSTVILLQFYEFCRTSFSRISISARFFSA